MRNKIFGGIGIVWGGLILLNWLISESPAGTSAAYQSGQSFAAILGAAMFVAGLYYFFRKSEPA